MKFPVTLLQNIRKAHTQDKIKPVRLMFARHKPGDDWKVGDPYPNFSRIKSNQSFNWSAYSIPIWTRFTDKKEYRKNHGVVGYRVGTIRFTSKFNKDFSDYTFDVKHKPFRYNYSHCELVVNKNLNKAQKRSIRMTLVHNCVVSIYPNTEPTNLQNCINYLRMLIHRFLILFDIAAVFNHFKLRV